MSKLLNFEDTVNLIKTGKLLAISAPIELLEKLPKGNYIAASTYYFIVDGVGGEYSDKYAVRKLPSDVIKSSKIITYDAQSMKNINKNIPQNGFGYCLIPFESPCHFEFALNAPNYDEFAVKTLYGFISGVRKEDIGIKKAVVKDGSTNTIYEDKAVVLNIELNDNFHSEIDIINPFEADRSKKIEFLEDAFEVSKAVINGSTVNFAHYLKEQHIDTRYPIINDAFGAKVNISFFKVEENKVIMGSPVFKGATYYFARQTNYTEELAKLKVDKEPTLSCNCFLNYIYMDLENKVLNESISGPSTFGEIAYRLLNQTIVNLYIKK
jgi:hypothetical protein